MCCVALRRGRGEACARICIDHGSAARIARAPLSVCAVGHAARLSCAARCAAMSRRGPGVPGLASDGLDVAALLGPTQPPRGDEQRGGQRPRVARNDVVPRHRSASPRTPPSRSPSVDSEADILPSERRATVRWARAIQRHWASGSSGRAPRPAWTTQHEDSVALQVRRDRADGVAEFALASATEPEFEIDEGREADRAGQSQGTPAVSAIEKMGCGERALADGPPEATHGAEGQLASPGAPQAGEARPDSHRSAAGAPQAGEARPDASSDDDPVVVHAPKQWIKKRGPRSRQSDV